MAREANERRAAEVASAAAAAEQRRMRERMEQLEEEARAANEERLELERKRLELEQAKQAEDQRQRDQAGRFRRLTSAATEFTNRIIAAIGSRPGEATPPGNGRIDPATLALSGAVCEILSQALSHEVLGAASSSNPYVTSEDLQRQKRLQSRVDQLHDWAQCTDFVLTVRKLLMGEASRCTAAAVPIDALLARWQAADDACTGPIAEIIETLRIEWYLLLHFHRRSKDTEHTLLQLQNFCPAQSRRIHAATLTVNRTALDSFRPDASRVQAARDTFTSTLDAYGLQCEKLVGQCQVLVDSTNAHVAEGRVILPKSAVMTDDAIGIGPLGETGACDEFLEFRKPPTLAKLTCSPALMLFLNVAENVASGKIIVEQAQSIGGAHVDFMKAVTRLDGLLSKAGELPQKVQERLAAAAKIRESVLRIMGADRIERVAADMRRAITRASLELKRSEELARIGDIAFGGRLRDQATRKITGVLDTRTVDAVIQDQQTRLEALEASFSNVMAVAERRATGLRGFVSELFSDNAAGELRDCLEAFFRHMTETRWGAGTELARGFCQRVQHVRTFCTELEYRPSLRAWVILHDALDRTRPRDIGPTGAFVNALCAMAAAHDAIDGKEAAAIHKAVKARRVAIEEPHVDEIIREWNTVVAEKRLLSAVAQAVIDVSAISDSQMLANLNEELKNVARADANLNDTEISVYQAFLAAIMRQMYANLLPT